MGEGRGGEQRGGEGRGGSAPPLLCPHGAFSCSGWVGERVKLQLEELCPRRYTLGGRGGRVPVLWGWGGKRGPVPRGVGVPRHMTEAEVGPHVPRQWEWKVSHGHLPTCTGVRVHPCTREARAPAGLRDTDGQTPRDPGWATGRAGFYSQFPSCLCATLGRKRRHKELAPTVVLTT